MRVFLTSPWIPGEWVRAHGFEPRGVWSVAEFRRGSLPLSAGVCAFAEAAVRFAEAQPEFRRRLCHELRPTPAWLRHRNFSRPVPRISIQSPGDANPGRETNLPLRIGTAGAIPCGTRRLHPNIRNSAARNASSRRGSSATSGIGAGPFRRSSAARARRRAAVPGRQRFVRNN